MNGFVDLHIHSIHSDGVHPPETLVRMAAESGLKAIAIADHDSVDGVEEALAAGIRYGVEVLPAVELSVQFKEYRDVHLLGYLIDHKDAAFNEKLQVFRSARDHRGKAIVERINTLLASQNQQQISYEAIAERTEGALGRPHIARELVAKGLSTGMEDAFNRFLVPCDVEKHYFPIEEAVAEVRRLGGVTSLAHPVSITDNRVTLRGIITELTSLGLQGVEVFNNMSTRDDSDYLTGIAWRLGLVSTGGSDYHGGEDSLKLGILHSGMQVPYEVVESLKGMRRT